MQWNHSQRIALKERIERAPSKTQRKVARVVVGDEYDHDEIELNLNSLEPHQLVSIDEVLLRANRKQRKRKKEEGHGEGDEGRSNRREKKLRTSKPPKPAKPPKLNDGKAKTSKQMALRKKLIKSVKRGASSTPSTPPTPAAPKPVVKQDKEKKEERDEEEDHEEYDENGTLVVIVTDDEDENPSSSKLEKNQITTVAEAISNQLDLKKQLLSFRHQDHDIYDRFLSPIGLGAPSIADVVSVQYTSFTNPEDVDESNKAPEALFTAIRADDLDEVGEWGDDGSTSTTYGPVTRKKHDQLESWAEAQRSDVKRKEEERMVDERLRARNLENQRLQAQHEENKRKQALLQQEEKEKEKRRAEAAVAEALELQRAARERMLAEEQADNEVDGW